MKGFQPLEKVRSRRIPRAQGRLTFTESGVIVPQLLDSLYYLIISETRSKHKSSKKTFELGIRNYCYFYYFLRLLLLWMLLPLL